MKGPRGITMKGPRGITMKGPTCITMKGPTCITMKGYVAKAVTAAAADKQGQERKCSSKQLQPSSSITESSSSQSRQEWAAEPEHKAFAVRHRATACWEYIVGSQITNC
jgi:hypothetical protein